MSYSSDGKTFLPWDPARPCRSHPCAHCGKPDATKRCTRCTLAHYCGRDCQQSHWGAHKAQCKAGVPAYLDRVAEQVRKQAALLQRADVAAEVVATLEETLALARAMGDAEGERHLTSTLAHRCNLLAEGGGEGAEEYAAAAARHTERSEAIAAAIGPLNYKDVAKAVGGAGGAAATKLPPMQPPGADAAAGGAPPPPRAPDIGAMFGEPTDGDPLGLMSDAGLLGMPPMPAPAPPLAAPPSPPDDRPANADDEG